MPKDTPIAHSSDATKGITEQSYLVHAGNVLHGATRRASIMLQHFTDDEKKQALHAIVNTASEYHDLGKLADGFQKHLKSKGKDKSGHIRHEDAGTYALLKKGHIESAFLVSAHHQGLQNLIYDTSGEVETEYFRIDNARALTKNDTEEHWKSYLEDHSSLFDSSLDCNAEGLEIEPALTRRLLLSCLVDADHSDTADHYNDLPDTTRCMPRWDERLAALDLYIEGLEKKASSVKDETMRQRNNMRSQFYQACAKHKGDGEILACDAPVGSGKTTAVMAHLLRVARDKKLRHIFIVLPFTNIIRQSVETYRNALTLKGENPQEVVVEHHHQADFKDRGLRHLTTLWQAPIIVTTAVQFFETIAANHTGKLRKIHELPGSAIFLDEAHAALPAKYLPVAWRWMQTLSQNWSCSFVLASGSLSRYWELKSFRKIINADIPDVSNLENDEIRTTLHREETHRLNIVSESYDHAQDLVEKIISVKGPRIVVLNTVHGAALLARRMRKDGNDVLHLSTALTPKHRKIIIERIKANLIHKKNWTLIATSLVEAGMDFSFRNGFRERASTTSLIQLGGRVNRNAEYNDSVLYDFTLEDSDYPDNPSLGNSARVLSDLLEKGVFTDPDWNLERICTESLNMEFKEKTKNDAQELIEDEELAQYKDIADKFRVIEADTRVVVIDPSIVNKLEGFQKVKPQDIINNSIQLWFFKIEKLAFEQINNLHSSEIYKLPEGHEYDPDFLGYMEGVLSDSDYQIASGYLI